MRDGATPHMRTASEKDNPNSKISLLDDGIILNCQDRYWIFVRNKKSVRLAVYRRLWVEGGVQSKIGEM